MPQDIRQSNFAGGEVARELYGRSDLTKYASSLRRCRNFFIEQHGAAVKSPGTTIISEVKNSAGKVRLRPFVYDSNQAVVLELGAGYIRFYQNGAQLLTPTIANWAAGVTYNPGDFVTHNGSLYRAVTQTNYAPEQLGLNLGFWMLVSAGYAAHVPCEVSTAYTESDLFKLKFSQSGDVVTITRKGYSPMELRRLTPASDLWQFIPTVLGAKAPGVHAITAVARGNGSPVGHGMVIDNYYVNNPPTNGIQLRGWAVTAVDGDGNESLPTATSDVWCLVSTSADGGNIIQLQWIPDSTARRFRIYSGTQGYWGLLDDVDADFGNQYIDFGLKAPDFSQAPPQGRLPFSKAIPFPVSSFVKAGQRITSNGWTYEAVNAGFTGTAGPATKGPAEKDAKGPKIWGIEIPAYAMLGDRCYNHGNVYVCTVAGTVDIHPRENSLPGPSGEAKDYVDSVVPTSSPAHWAFVARGTRVLWKWIGDGDWSTTPEVVAEFDQRRFYSVENKIVASQVGDYGNFDVNAVETQASDAVSIDIASSMFEEIRNLLPSRVLLVLTSEAEWPLTGAAGVNDAISPMSAYARPHTFLGSSWLDAIRIGNGALMVQAMGNSVYELVFEMYTGSYSAVDLTIFATHLFENHQIVDWAYAKRPYGLVWAVREDGVLLGCTYNRTQEMLAWYWRDTQGTYESVCAVPEGSESAVYVVVQRTLPSGTKRYIERFASRLLTRDSHGVPEAQYGIFLDSAKAGPAAGAGVVTGLGHLEGLQVTGLVDGRVVGPYTVVDGSINYSDALPDGGTWEIFGLPYVSELETMNLSVPNANLRSSAKDVFRVSFELVESRGFQVGRDFDHLKEWQQPRPTSGDQPALFTGLDHVRISSRFEHEARIAVRHTDPLPLTIVGIGREVDVGGG